MSDFREKLEEHCKKFGGTKNYHIHGDRAYSRRDEYYDHIGKSVLELDTLSLLEKQQLTWALHQGSGFKPKAVEDRFNKFLYHSLNNNVKQIYSTVDITHNIGLKSLEVLNCIKCSVNSKRGSNFILLGAYNPSGFKDNDSVRFSTFEKGLKDCDFIVGLGEKDRGSEHIGEQQHNVYMLNLAYTNNMPVQFHVGQDNTREDLTIYNLMDSIRWVQDVQLRVSPDKFPKISMVHMISLSCHSREEIDRVGDFMVERNIDLICCPRAGLSNLQLKNLTSYTHNSIGPVLELIFKGVTVKLGIDNLDDIYVPYSSCSIIDEAECLAVVLRFSQERILAKIACGVELDEFDRATVSAYI